MKLSYKDFPLELTFRNTIPPAPNGPYFKNMEILSCLNNEIPEYRTSTLEKNYKWQPHVGADLGIQLCFVDHDSIVDKDKDKIPPLDPRDKAFIEGESKGKKSKVKSLDSSSQPWYFRQTTYIANNPFHSSNRYKGGDLVEKARKEKEKLIKKVDIYSNDFIEQSFDMVEKTVEDLKKKETKRKIVSCIPLLPEDDDHINRAFIRFDEDPASFHVMSDESRKKRYKMDHSIVSNTRAPEGQDSSKLLHCTLVAPVGDKEPESSANAEEISSEYKWVRDYSMDVQDSSLPDCFIFALDEQNESAYYFAVQTRIDMKKIKFSDAQPQVITVERTLQTSTNTEDS